MFSLCQSREKNPFECFLGPILFLYGLLNQYFVYFFGIFTLAQFYILYYTLKQTKRVKKICSMGYIVFFLLGSSCWLADQMLCELTQPYQLHAWWHFFTAFAFNVWFSSNGLNSKCLLKRQKCFSITI